MFLVTLAFAVLLEGHLLETNERFLAQFGLNNSIIRELGEQTPSVLAKQSLARSRTPRQVGNCPAVRSAAEVPARWELDSFYKKYVEAAGGIPVISSDLVSDEALLVAAMTINRMLAHRPDAARHMADIKFRYAVMAAYPKEKTTDIPEHSWLPKDYWDERARGLGATCFARAGSGAEENILCHSNDRYNGENICLHEFAHCVHEMGVKYVDPDLFQETIDAFEKRPTEHFYGNVYANTNFKEFFAENTQSYYDTNYGSSATPDYWTRKDLQTKANQMFNILDKGFFNDVSFDPVCPTDTGGWGGDLQVDCSNFWQGSKKRDLVKFPFQDISCGEEAPAPSCTGSPPKFLVCEDDSVFCGAYSVSGQCGDQPGCKKSCCECIQGTPSRPTPECLEECAQSNDPSCVTQWDDVCFEQFGKCGSVCKFNATNPGLLKEARRNFELYKPPAPAPIFSFTWSLDSEKCRKECSNHIDPFCGHRKNPWDDTCDNISKSQACDFCAVDACSRNCMKEYDAWCGSNILDATCNRVLIGVCAAQCGSRSTEKAPRETHRGIGG